MSILTINPAFKNFARFGRQVHLDFHTSGFIKDVATDFDAEDFALQMKKANINSVTVFAKCHHGLSYYPTKTGLQHPGMGGKDLFGMMIEALHKHGIRAACYSTVGWEDRLSVLHPDWRSMRKDGVFADLEKATDLITEQPANWKFNNLIHPDYMDHIEAHLNEILDNYDVDGFFIDIVFVHPKGGWSESERAFRKKYNLLADNLENQTLYESKVQEVFCKRFFDQIESRKRGISTFFNGPNNRYTLSKTGILAHADSLSHFEIESLPSGVWGYYHFPRIARQLAPLDKAWLGMTGKFQRMWGDFGGLKPQAALEYECFKPQALGGGNSVGDQLHPRARPDADTYALIGNVYEQIQAAEPFYQDSTAVFDIGIITPNAPHLPEHITHKSEEAATLLLESLHLNPQMLNADSDFDHLPVLLLPDYVEMNASFAAKLKKYYLEGGKLILSYMSGHDRDGNWLLDFLPIRPHGHADLFPNYWLNKADYLTRSTERVFYKQGLNVEALEGAKVAIERILPYFQRTDLQFCSHFQTPPNQPDSSFAAGIEGNNFFYFADPIFEEYRQYGNKNIKDSLEQIITFMAVNPIATGLPTRAEAIARRKADNLLLTLLHYVPVRKCIDTDMIEEANTFAGEHIRLAHAGVKHIYCHTTNQTIEVDSDGFFALPAVKGRLLLEVKNYFAD